MKQIKLKSIVIVFSISSLMSTANAGFANGAKEGGGWGYFNSLYSCTEKNASNPQNPKLAFLTQFKSGHIQLIVRPTLGSFNDGSEYVFSGNVVRDTSIKCFVECEIYNTQDGENVFGLTKIDNTYEGLFEYQGDNLSFECKAGQ